ncbi:MAG: hypothetical protein ABFC98_05790 [Candidatus Cloacimonas sp.]
MCEINPKRKEFFRLEFFTSTEISDEEWKGLIIERLLLLEQVFNLSGEIRAHIHEELEEKG